MRFDHDLLHRDVKSKMRLSAMSQNEMVENIGVARSTLWRLSKGKDITLETLIKLLEWTKKDINRYIIKNETTKGQDIG